MTDTPDALKERLRTLRQTASYLLEKAAAVGGEVRLDPKDRHSLDQTRADIAQCIAELRRRGVVVDDQPEDTATIPVPPGAQREAGSTVHQSGGANAGQGNTFEHVGMFVGGDYYAGSPAPGHDLDAAQALLDRLPLDQIPPVQTLPSPHRMPLASNPLFVGRAEDFRALAALLKAGGTAVITTGIGGMGKTQLAAEIAHRYGAYFAGGVFWISCADPAAIAGQVAECGEVMGLPLAGIDQDAQVRRTWAEWETDRPRLLILDNCEDEATLQTWKPKTGETRVLVTSRRASWSTTLQVQVQPLGLLSLPESVALLRKHRADLAEADAQQIAEELGRLPLALHLAGSFLARYHTITPAAYLAKLRSPDLLDHPSLQGRGVASMPTEREPNVSRAFALSFERLNPHDRTDILARQLLARAACLAPGEPFPCDLLMVTVEVEGDDETRELALTDALERLIGLGLLEREDGDVLRLHRLIVAYVQGAFTDDDALRVMEQAVNSVASQANKAGLPAVMLPVLPHMRHLVRLALSSGREDEQMVILCNNLGLYLDDAGVYGEAQPLLEQTLDICERVLGPEHPYTVMLMSNLGLLYKTQGTYDRALPLLEQALQVCEQTVGVEHLSTARSLNNLASLYDAQGAYNRTEPLYERALQICKQTVGVGHPFTAIVLNNIATMYQEQGAYDRAQPLLEQALQICEQMLGAEHPSTVTVLNNLAAVYQEQRAYDRAQPLLERALQICERVLGVEHPSMSRSLDNLALLYFRQGDYQQALPLHEQALSIAEWVLGVGYPHTRECRANLRRCQADIHLGPLPPADNKQLDAVLTQAHAARDAALADPAADRRALATAIEVRARWAETGDADWQVCAAELRALIAQLGVEPDDPDAVR